MYFHDQTKQSTKDNNVRGHNQSGTILQVGVSDGILSWDL